MVTQSYTPEVSRKWYQIWRAIWLHPSLETFQSVLAEPGAGPRRGFIWVAVAQLIAGLLNGLFSLGSINGSPSLLTIVIVDPLFAIAGLAIGAGIYHVTARIFKGEGTWGHLVFCFAGIQALDLLFVALYKILIALLPASVVLLIFAGLVGVIFAIYCFGIYVYALAGVEKIGKGAALFTLLMPVIVLVALYFLVVHG
jgi:hypothetical protein